MNTSDTSEERIEEPLSVFQSILNQIILDEDNSEYNADYYKEYYIKIMTEALHQQLQKAREEERERCIKIVEDYGKSMSRLHSEMIGTAHEDSKMMLAFDMHSRLIAVKHITEKMNHSELDQDNN